jgi:diguanylate cyclase (GGDEF)-like protein
MALRFLLHFSPHGRRAPKMVQDFAESGGYELVEVASVDDLVTRVNRAYPMAIIVDASRPADVVVDLCRTVKAEAFTAVVPVIAYVVDGGPDANADALEAGADEVLCGDLVERECRLRLSMALWRAERDVSVHPTTRLPGTVQIERDIGERLASGDRFAVCYADLDHFKEFNDRYGYNNGDRVILLLSRILRDVVRARSTGAFVGHIGGDDFIFNCALADYHLCCEEVISVFEELIPFQYSVEDRARGFFQGKDRRGELYEVPLMTLSIGVVTNQLRDFTHTAQISELATEMKAYAKTLPGSVFAVDRRKI